MTNWKTRSRIYSFLRHIFPANLFFKEECDAIARFLAAIPEAPKTLLDLGTGTGDSLHLVKNAQKRVLLDHSWSMLSRVKCGTTDYRVIGDLESLPLKSGQFDILSCIGASEYVAGKAALLRQIFLVLKPGGHALVTFSPKSWYTTLRNLLGIRIYPLSESTVQDLVTAQSFYIVKASRTRMQSQFLLQKL